MVSRFVLFFFCKKKKKKNLIPRYRRSHNCLDSHAVREVDQSVWVEASLHSHRFSAVKVLLSLAHSLWTRLVLLSEQISIAQRSRATVKRCALVLVLTRAQARSSCTAAWTGARSPCHSQDIRSMRWLLTFWQVEPKLCFGLECGYLMSQPSRASLSAADDPLINLTDSSLFLVSARRLFWSTKLST